MAYITLENFKYGIDSRRSEFTSQPGTLSMLVNGHVNQGGEVEKRKAFVPYGNFAAIVDSLGDRGTYGLQAIFLNDVPTNAVFGSALPFGSVVTLGQPILSAAMPMGFAYYQLQHPAVVAGVNYDRAKHRLVTVTASSVFGGLPWCAATFSDGLTFCYYNGILVPSSFFGLVLDGQVSNNEIAAAVGLALTTYLQSAGYVITVVGNVVTLIAPAGDIYTQNITVFSPSGGLITKVHVADSVPGTPAKGASAGFTITSIPTHGSVQAVKYQDPTSLAYIDVLNGAIAGAINPSTLAAQIVNQINAAAVNGFSASKASNNPTSVVVQAPASLGGTINSLLLEVDYNANGGDDMTISVSGQALSALVSVNSITVSRFASARGTSLRSSPIFVTPYGGTKPYKYLWIAVGGVNNGITPVSPASSSTIFTAIVKHGQSLSASYQCLVTDSTNPSNSVVSQTVNVIFKGL